VRKIRYLGVDFAWSHNNFSALSLLENNQLIETLYLQSDQEILDYIHTTKPDKIGVDAALEVPNETGNRSIENQILKDFAKYKLGVYPINRTIMQRLYGGNRAEELFSQLESYHLRENLFEVYTHATILRCFTHDHVLPYKRKKGRTTPFIKEQLEILQSYLHEVVESVPSYPIQEAKSKELKVIEDKLDSIVCAYSLYVCETQGFNSYDGLLLVPRGEERKIKR
jgi:predicted RNase H-like nuclease